MFFCFTGKFRDLLPVFFHDIHFSILLFTLRKKKRGQLDLREKKKITVLCQITKFQTFLQIFLYISGHTHLRRCDFHAFPPHVSFFSFYHLEYDFSEPNFAEVLYSGSEDFARSARSIEFLLWEIPICKKQRQNLRQSCDFLP